MANTFTKIEFTKDRKNVEFYIHDVDVSIVNALRRVILSEITNVAISFDPYKQEFNDIKFTTNTTSLHNEFLGHRISLLPIHLTTTQIQKFEPKQYKFIIDLRNNTNNIVDVTTKDIKVFDENDKTLDSKQMFPPYIHNDTTEEFILITRLKPNMYDTTKGEHLKVEFNARKGIAKDHARWQMVSTCTFTNVLDYDKIEKMSKDLIKSINLKSDIEKKKILNKFETLDKYRIYKMNKYGEPGAFKFIINSECAVQADDIFTMGFDTLIQKCNNFKIEAEEEIDKNTSLYMVVIKNEDHTLGNLLQAFAYNTYVRENQNLEFIGYYQPHPLENNIVFKIKFASNDHPDVKSFFYELLRKDITVYLEFLKQIWINRG